MALNWSVAVLIAFIHVCVGTPWATPSEEALDEVHDAEIYRAVWTSMQEWHKRHPAGHQRRRRAESQVCYDDGLGCFRDSGPFGYLDMLPGRPEDVNTRFLLYTSAGAGGASDVPFANISLVWRWAEASFNKSQPTKVIVHGFGSDCDHVWVYEMQSALQAVEACNVICVDWGAGAATPNYVKAAANTRLVGKQVALLLEGLQARGLSLESTHVIGFSLGAHVAGFAGAQLVNLSRITGLDPAGPLFESQDPRARLDSSDAMFVDVIHSNGENLILGGLGSWQPMGHVDFYPNGGRMQKGCSNLFVGAVSDILWSATEVEGRSLCNHRRAYKFFTDSLSPRCHFPAFPCESYDKFLEGGCFPCAGDKRCGNMGYYADKSAVRGTLYLITRDEEPFCAHQYHVRVESAPSDPPTVSYGRMQVTLLGNADINETFTLTQKDDAEIRVGVALTRIAVPHPALREPRAVQLTYTAYSGWLSSGLASWPVDKLALTDSFGNSLSVCKKGLQLETGVPVTLPLYPGECNPPRDSANATTTTTLPPNTTATSLLDMFRPSANTTASLLDMFGYSNATSLATSNKTVSASLLEMFGYDVNPSNLTTSSAVNQSTLLDMFLYKPTPVVQMGDDADAVNNNSLLEKIGVHEDSRAFQDRLEATSSRPEIKEPVLPSTTTRPGLDWSGTRNSSSFRPRAISLAAGPPSAPPRPEITEPVLNPRPRPPDTWQPRSDTGKQLPTVQVFPKRLAAILNQAERFARNQLFSETERRGKHYKSPSRVLVNMLGLPQHVLPHSRHDQGKYIPFVTAA